MTIAERLERLRELVAPRPVTPATHTTALAAWERTCARLPEARDIYERIKAEAKTAERST